MSARAPHILFFAFTYSVDGDSQWLEEDLVQALLRRGARVDVVVFDFREPRPSGIQRSSTKSLRVFSVGPETSSHNDFQRALHLLSTLRRLWSFSRHVARSHDTYDLCVSTSPAMLSGGVPGWLRRRRRCRRNLVILWDFFPTHQLEIGRLRSQALGSVLARLEAAAIRSADVISLPSDRFAEVFRRLHGESGSQRTTIIPNWAGNGPVPASAIARSGSTFRAVFGGQLAPGRGLHTILDAAKILRDQDHQGIEIVIAGSGPDAEILKGRIRTEHIDNVSILGRLPRDEYLRLLGDCDAGLVVTVPNVSVPSSPAKVSDYLRCGLPIIACVEAASDFGDMIESVGCGISVPAGSPADLARALVAVRAAMTTGEAAAMGERGLAYYEAELTADRAAERVLALLPQY